MATLQNEQIDSYEQKCHENVVNNAKKCVKLLFTLTETQTETIPSGSWKRYSLPVSLTRQWLVNVMIEECDWTETSEGRNAAPTLGELRSGSTSCHPQRLWSILQPYSRIGLTKKRKKKEKKWKKKRELFSAKLWVINLVYYANILFLGDLSRRLVTVCLQREGRWELFFYHATR